MSEIKSILEYYNSFLYPRDLFYLEDKEWLNDNCIHFIFKWFQFSKFSNNQHNNNSNNNNNQFLFLDPSVVSQIRLQFLDDDDIKDLHKGIQFNSKSYLFIPCNNQNSFLSHSIHWSLLVIDMISHQIYSLDSSFPFNSSNVSVLVEILCLKVLAW